MRCKPFSYLEPLTSEATLAPYSGPSVTVTLKRRGELPILFDHMMSGKSGNGVLNSVLVFECHLEYTSQNLSSFEILIYMDIIPIELSMLTKVLT